MSKEAFYEKYVQSPVNLNQSSILASLSAVSPMNTSSEYLKAFYENALKKSTKVPLLKKKNQDVLDSQDEQTLADVEPIQADPDFLAYASIDNSIDLIVEQDTSITLTNNKTDHVESVAMWSFPLAVIGGYAIRGGGDSAAPSQNANTCKHEPLAEFTLPAKPSATGALQINLARGEELLQLSVDALDNHYDAGDTSLIITLAEHSNLDGVDGVYVINASGNMGDIYFSAGVSARSDIKVNASESVGDVIVTLGKETTSINKLEIDASGDVGNLSMLTSGNEAGGTLQVQAFDGDIGTINYLSENMSGGGRLRASAYNDGFGVGGNIGDVNFTITGPEASGDINLLASGGDIGDISLSSIGGSASGSITLYAVEQSGYGGNIGDISILAVGASANPKISAYASHNIGNISMNLSGFTTEIDIDLKITSGGTVGNIDIQVGGDSCSPLDANESDGTLNIYGGDVSIGDVTMALNGGLNDTARFAVGDFRDASLRVDSVGDITLTATADSYSGSFYVNAITDTTGIVSSVGNIIIDNQGFNGDHDIYIWAKQISGMSAFIGHGSANARITMHTGDGSGASVGDIFVTMGDEHFGSGGDITAMYALGTEVGNIVIDGGSEFSRFAVLAGGNFNGSQYGENPQNAYYFRDTHVIGDIDMSQFDGFSNITLSTVQNSVRIDVGLAGSRVRGSEASDSIYLNAGEDTIYFDAFKFSRDNADTIYNFDLLVEGGVDVISSVKNMYAYTEITSNTLISILDRTIVALTDLVDGDDLSTEIGLINALSSGEYDNINLNAGDYSFATAFAADGSFNLYHVTYDGASVYTADLMAEVNLGAGMTFADISSSSFYTVVI